MIAKCIGVMTGIVVETAGISWILLIPGSLIYDAVTKTGLCYNDSMLERVLTIIAISSLSLISLALVTGGSISLAHAIGWEDAEES